MGIAELQQKDELEKQRASLDKRLSELGNDLLIQNQSIARSVKATREILALLQQPEIQGELPFVSERMIMKQGKKLNCG